MGRDGGGGEEEETEGRKEQNVLSRHRGRQKGGAGSGVGEVPLASIPQVGEAQP